MQEIPKKFYGGFMEVLWVIWLETHYFPRGKSRPISPGGNSTGQKKTPYP